ncbi:MAG: hypothetical protein ACSLFM_10530 [Tepidiformaceae bacterium]
MSVITWTLEADFDRSGTYETDLTGYVENPAGGIGIDRGMGQMGEFAISTMKVGLSNRTGYFSPGNSASPFYGKVTPGVPIRLKATHDAVDYTLWTGYIQRITPSGGSGRVRTAAAECYDLAYYLKESDPINVTASASRDTDGALDAIRTAMGLASGDVSLDDGVQNLPMHFVVGQPAADAWRNVVASEMGGLMWVTAAGLLRFESRASRLGVTPDDTWGDGTNIVPYDFSLEIDDTEIVTSVTARSTVFRSGQADTEIFRFSQNKDTKPTATSMFITAGTIYQRTFQAASAYLTLTAIEANVDYLANTAQNGSGTDRTSTLNPTVTDLGGGKFTVKFAPTLDCYVTKFRVRAQPVEFFADRAEASFSKSVSLIKSGRSESFDIPFAGDSGQTLRDYAYQVLRIGRYPAGRLTLNFHAGAPGATADDDKKVALLSAEIGDLIKYKDTGLGVDGSYSDDWYYIERLQYVVPPDFAGASFMCSVTLVPTSIYRNLDRIVFDTFDRANATGDLGSSFSGDTWANDGNMDIASNAARANSDTLQMPNLDLGAGAASTVTVAVAVSASADDAYEDSTGVVTLDDAFTVDVDATNEWIGLRFQGVAIPADATIQEAHLSLFVPNFQDEPDVVIHGVDADNTGTFTTGANDISGRPRTTANVAWASTDLGGDGVFDSPDLTSIVQEIVDRAGWAPGNAMAFVINGRSGADPARDFGIGTYEWFVDENNPDPVAPTLSVTYTVDDQVVEVSLAAIGAGDEVGVVFRYADANNQYRAYLDKGSNEVILEKNVATVVTELASPAFTVGTAHEIRAMVQGTRIRVWVDFVLYIDTTDSALSAGTKVGLFARNASGSTTFEDAYGQAL